MSRNTSLEEGLASAKHYALVGKKAFGFQEKRKIQAALRAIAAYTVFSQDFADQRR